MQVLVLNRADQLEDNILAIIDFVKRVEKEHGLTDEQIIVKYTCRYCSVLACDFVVKTLHSLLGVEEDEVDASLQKVATRKAAHHYYVELKQRGKKPVYFDILGKKSLEEMQNFVNSDYWDETYKKPWVGDFMQTHASDKWGYVQLAINNRTIVEGITDQV